MKTTNFYSRLAFIAFSFLLFNLVFLTRSSAQCPYLYGTTKNGGAHGGGTIFSYKITTGAVTDVWDFGNGTDGYYPLGDSIYDAGTGKFFGMTSYGGTNGTGIIFSFNPGTNAEADVWNFGSPNDAEVPTGDLVYDASNGYYYAMTSIGGMNNEGAIISFYPTTNAESVVYSFQNNLVDGRNPYGSLLLDPTYTTTTFFGMTAAGGSNGGGGTIFSFVPSTATESPVCNFGAIVNGPRNPHQSLVLDPTNSFFYAMSEFGGANGYGCVFKFDPSSSTYTPIYSFGNLTSNNPNADLVYDAANSTYYGTTVYGASAGEGTIISVSPTNTLTPVSIVYNFQATDPNDGALPYGNLVWDIPTQLFYGTTEKGGTNNDGTVFSFNPSTNAEVKIHDFAGSGTDGANPYGSLVHYFPASCSLTASASVVQNVLCNGGSSGSASSSGSSGGTPYTYSWSSGSTVSSATSLTAGTYTVTVTDACGCTATATVSITQPTAPIAFTPSTYQGMVCTSGLKASLEVVSLSGGTSPYTYLWTDGSTTTSSSNPTTRLWSTGTYTVTVTDNNGCSASASYFVGVTATYTVYSYPACYGGLGNSKIIPGGNSGDYSYLWEPGGMTNQQLTNLSAGTYTVTVTDGHGCTATTNVVITQPTALTASITPSGCDGIATATGGVTPYTYSWSPGGATTSSITLYTTSGIYTVTVKDKNHCTATATVSTTCPSAPPRGNRNGSSSNGFYNGVEDLSSIYLYPNPNTGQFSLYGLEPGMILEVYDYTGKKISSITASDNTMQLSLSTEANGMYLIRILNKDGTLVDEKKVVKRN